MRILCLNEEPLSCLTVPLLVCVPSVKQIVRGEGVEQRWVGTVVAPLELLAGKEEAKCGRVWVCQFPFAS